MFLRNGGERVDTSRHCCDGRCASGDCPLIVRRVPIPTRLPAPRVQMRRHRVSRWKRSARFLADLWAFLTAPRWMP